MASSLFFRRLPLLSSFVLSSRNDVGGISVDRACLLASFMAVFYEQHVRLSGHRATTAILVHVPQN